MNKDLFDDDIASSLGNPPKHIKGIVCSVKNCIYHDSDGYCTAKGVNIGPSFASSCTDTVCATFRKNPEEINNA